MVWPLPPASATARSCSIDSTLAAESATATFGTSEAVRSERYFVRLIKSRTGKEVVIQRYLLGCPPPKFHTSRSLYFCFEFRRRVPFQHGVRMALENKEASIFDQDLLELARKTVSPLAGTSEYPQDQSPNKRESRGTYTGRNVQESRQFENTSDQIKKPRSQFKATKFVLDSSKHHFSLPGYKKSIWKSLGSGSRSLKATPLAPLPPFLGGLFTFIGFFLVFGLLLDKWIGRASRGVQLSDTSNAWVATLEQQKAPTGISVFLERDLKKKESVEWVNMVLGKLWKVYRLGLESWLVGLLQPLIDNLQKPDYVKRVQIKQFYLGDEPISVRSVERRASRRANDLQYHIGLRYTGGARMLLLLKLKAGFLPITIPVGVRELDVDGELWVKLRLVPSEPWVGTATWAFVSLPKIKLDLSPFRLFNLMAIPFLSVFLTKLLTRDLPQLFVRPNKNVIDFLKGKAVGPVTKDFKGATLEGNKDFSGELSVTLVDARKISYVPYGKTDPYVVLVLGDQVVQSKKNSQTSVFGPPGRPIWNQDFQLLVIDPKTQRLTVRVRDYFGLTSFTVGVGEVELSALQDTVPTDRVVSLRGGWGPFQKRFAGELLLRLTYTAYVEDEDENGKGDRPLPFSSGYASDVDEKSDSSTSKVVNKATGFPQGKESLTEMFAAVIAEVNSEVLGDSLVTEAVEEGSDSNGGIRAEVFISKNVSNESGAESIEGTKGRPLAVETEETERANGRTVLLWLGLLAGLAVLVDISLNFSNFLNP